MKSASPILKASFWTERGAFPPLLSAEPKAAALEEGILGAQTVPPLAGQLVGRWSCNSEGIKNGGFWTLLAFLHHPALKSWTCPRSFRLQEIIKEPTVGCDNWLRSKEKVRGDLKTVPHNRWRWAKWLEPGNSSCLVKNIDSSRTDCQRKDWQLSRAQGPAHECEHRPEALQLHRDAPKAI